MMTLIQLDLYDLHVPLNRGAMGEVWKAVHRPTGYPVAVKVLTRPDAREPAYYRYFRKEVEAAARLDHQSIVQVFDFGVVSQQAADVADSFEENVPLHAPYLVMELVPGGTLTDHSPESWRELRRLMIALLDALAHAHARGVVHRDIKPANILIGESPQGIVIPRITDFGLAHHAPDYNTTRTGGLQHWTGNRVLGTPLYMAPEQLERRWFDLGPWTDLYALGIAAWEMAGARLPYRGRSVAELLDQKRLGRLEPFEAAMEVPPGFERWLRQLCAHAPRDRFQDATEARYALQALPAPSGNRRPPMPAQRSTTVHTLTTSARILDEPAPAPRSLGIPLMALRRPRLTGRDDERAAMMRILEESTARREAKAVVIRGPYGMGRTELSRWLCERSAELGKARAVHAVHNRVMSPGSGLPRALANAFRAVAFDPLLVVKHLEKSLEELDLGEGSSTRLAKWIVRRAHPQGPSTVSLGHLPSRAELIADLRALLFAMAREKPLVVRLDDVHYSEETMSVVEACLFPPIQAPVTFVLTIPDAPDARHQPGWTRAADLERAGATGIRLEPLPKETMAELLAARWPIEKATAFEIGKISGGNPQTALFILRDLVEDNRGALTPDGWSATSTVRATMAFDFDTFVQIRLDSADIQRGTNRELALLTAAALGREFDSGEWEQACRHAGIEPEWASLERLVLLGIMDTNESGFVFTYTAVYEALLRRLAANPRVQRIHEGCAAVVEPKGLYVPAVSLDRWAYHLGLAGRLIRAIDARRKAARQHRARGALRAAEHGLIEALRLVETQRREDNELRMLVRAELADLLIDEGRLDDAAGVLGAIPPGHTGIEIKIRGLVGIVRARLALWNGQPRQARAALASVDPLKLDERGSYAWYLVRSAIASWMGDRAFATSMAREAMKVAADKPSWMERALRALARAALMSGEFEDAQRVLETSQFAHPEREALYVWLRSIHGERIDDNLFTFGPGAIPVSSMEGIIRAGLSGASMPEFSPRFVPPLLRPLFDAVHVFWLDDPDAPETVERVHSIRETLSTAGMGDTQLLHIAKRRAASRWLGGSDEYKNAVQKLDRAMEERVFGR